MNHQDKPTRLFSKAAHAAPSDFQTEREVSRRAIAYEINRRTYFQKEGWRLAGYALDLLLEKTRGKYRIDGVTPEWIHSARPTELLESLTQSGFLDRAKVEAHYGSYEIGICAQLLHDLGENEGVTPEFLHDYFQQRIANDSDPKYHSVDRLKDRMRIPPIMNDFRLLTHEKGGERSFDEYLHDILQSGYGFLTKLGDRADNLATFIGLNRPDWSKEKNYPQDSRENRHYFERIRKYYSHTAYTFSTNDLVGEACLKHPLLAKAFDAMDSVLGFQFVLNRAYVGYHPMNPENAPDKSKRLSGSHLVVNISPYFEKAVKAYHHTHHGVNPLEIILGRIREEADRFPVLDFKYQAVPRDRGLSAPSAYNQIIKMFDRGVAAMSL